MSPLHRVTAGGRIVFKVQTDWGGGLNIHISGMATELLTCNVQSSFIVQNSLPNFRFHY